MTPPARFSTRISCLQTKVGAESSYGELGRHLGTYERRTLYCSVAHNLSDSLQSVQRRLTAQIVDHRSGATNFYACIVCGETQNVFPPSKFD